MPDAPANPAVPPSHPRSQFGLRTLFAILTLAAVVAAAFVWDELAGIFTYLGCFLLFMSVWRYRTIQAQIDSAHPPAQLRLVQPETIVLYSLLISLAAGLLFCTVCTFAQMPFVTIGIPRPGEADHGMVRFRLGLLVSIPFGTLWALLVYWLTWPGNGSPGSETSVKENGV